MLRVIKVRSLENAIYTKNYNRVRFSIMADNMSTDLSESYLAFKMNVLNGATGLAYTKADINNFNASDVMFSFGDSTGDSYSPACMIKVARLFYKEELLEEIQYSNVLSQTLHQFKNDFETIASESLLSMNSTGMMLNGSLASSTSPYFGSPAELNDPSVQVNIKLSDLFGVCRSTNFWIDGHIQVELELEDSKSLITQSVVAQLSTPLPTSLTTAANTTTVGFTPDASTNAFSVNCANQNLFSPSSNQLASIRTKTNNIISTPKSYKFGSTYIDYLFPNGANMTPVQTDNIIRGNYYRIVELGALSYGNWVTLGWTGSALPVIGNFFLCATPLVGLPYVNAQCILVNSTNQIVGIPGSNSNALTINPSFQWSVANMESLNISTGVLIKLVFTISQSGRRDRIFEYISRVTGISQWLNSAIGAKITFRDNILYPKYDGTFLNGATVSLTNFEVIPNSYQVISSVGNYNNLINNNTMTGVDVGTIINLQLAGVLSGGTSAQINAGSISKLTGANVFFSLGASMNSSVGGTNYVSVYPDQYTSSDIPSLRKLFSNQTKMMPTQSGQVRIVNATRNVANSLLWDLKFQTMGLENNNSLQGFNMIAPGTGGNVTSGLGVNTAITSWYMTILNYKKVAPSNANSMVVGEWYMILNAGSGNQAQWKACGNDDIVPQTFQSFICVAPMTNAVNDATVVWCQPNKSASTYSSKTWNITKAELVLVQHERDPAMPPSSIYPTFKCEAVTIENNLLAEYNRQFIITEMNCFNVLLCTPNYSADSADLYPESLISKSRNINQYRWSVNNIDNTNRQVVVKNNVSSYPSTLHLDKLMDCFSNDVGGLRNCSGVNGVSRSDDAPVVFPLKIYTASDAESHYMNPISGYTLQWGAYGDATHNMYITPGPIFLFKQCFKTLP